MNPASALQIAEYLQAWSAGDQVAVGQIVELVYPELHWIAKKHLYHERPDHSIHATALVNETYLRLVKVPARAQANKPVSILRGCRSPVEQPTTLAMKSLG
jgi:hypothetical protein